MKTELLETIIEKLEYYGEKFMEIILIFIGTILMTACCSLFLFMSAYGLTYHADNDSLHVILESIMLGVGLMSFVGLAYGLFMNATMFINVINDLIKGE